MEKEQKREFTGVWIPKEIILDDRLKPVDKILYAEIACYSECYKKQSELLKICGVKRHAFNESCGRLVEYGYISQCRKFGRIYRKSTFSIPKAGDEQSEKPTDEQSEKGAVHIDNTTENTNIAEASSAEPTPDNFNLELEIEKLLKDKRKDLQIIGWFFKHRKPYIPTKKVFNTQLKRWLKTAGVLAGYPVDDLNKAIRQVKEKNDKASFDWQLSTIEKYILNIRK